MTIEISGLKKSWNHILFENVNLKIPKGDFVYIVGESGAGKSTLMRMLYAEEKPDLGTVKVNSQNVLKLNFLEKQNLRRKMGIIFQDLRLVDELTVWDNIALSAELSSKKNSSKKAVDEIIQILGLSKVARKHVKLLSGGEKQKVAIARALVRAPEILIADEPTAGLDKEQALNVMDLILKMNLRGMTVILATHDRDLVRRIRKRSVVLHSGKVHIEEGMSLL